MSVNDAVCTHCQAPLAPGQRGFCCHGCATAHGLLAACGLGDHARLRAAAVAAGTAPRPVMAVVDEADWATWSDPAFLARHGQVLSTGALMIAWSVEGLHCPACVWVLERLPFLVPGVTSATIDLGRGVLRTVLDPGRADARTLAQVAAQLGYRLRPWAAEADQQRRVAARRLLLQAAVAFAGAVGSMQLAMNLAAGELTGDLDAGSRLFFGSGAVLLAVPAATWAVGPWWRAVGRAVRSGRWSLDATSAVVIAVGMSASVINLARGSNEMYADAVAMFAALLLAGRVVLRRVQDHLAVQGSRLSGLLPLTPPVLGEHITVRAGQRIPADGTVVEVDRAALDVALLTGESWPHHVESGATVLAGSLVISGSLALRVEAVGAATRIGQWLATAEAEAAAQHAHAGDSAWERWYGPVLLLLAVAVAPLGLGRSVAVIMAACPCAIGLALPLMRAHVLVAARARGALVRSADTLVRMREVQQLVVDKTGTLTTGSPLIVAWEWLVPAAEQAWYAGAIAAAERGARHPVALAIVRHLGAVPAFTASEIDEQPGRGLRALVEGRELRIGPVAGGGLLATCAERPIARLRVHDGVRDDAPALVRASQARGWRVTIASGDAPEPVAAVAQHLGIERWHASLLPEAKAELVDRQTLMIGDGFNDSLALAKAGVGIAVRGGLAAGLGCAAVVITDDARPLAAVRELICASQRLAQRENMLLAGTVAYNLIAVSCAAAGWWGPLICAIGMPLSSIAAIAVATGWQPFAQSQKANQPEP